MNSLKIQEYISSILDYNFYFDGGLKDKRSNIDFERVYRAVTSSKFRKSKLSEETEKNVRDKTLYYAQRKEPLQFSVPFGAYKSYKLNLDFMPDWAEVFNVSYLLKYATHILKEYPYGINFYYTYSADIMHIASDIPIEKCEDIRSSLKEY